MAWDIFCRRVSLCALLLLGAVGCQGTQQGGLPNPFLTADRVPAPATRLPAVGAAQPYYPGDAIPSLPTVQPLGTLGPRPEITPIRSGDGNLASTEPAVRIPSDDTTIRFAARRPAEASPPRIAMTPVQAAGSPRIRLPQSDTRFQEQVVAPGSIHTMSYQVPLGPVEVAAPVTASPTAPALLRDGFRARRSARSTWDRERDRVSPSIATLRVTPR